MSTLQDGHGRGIEYLRLSVTDRCDFRCVYCMAEDMTFLPRQQVLTLEEMHRVAALFVANGTRKIRLTGGEPLVRQGIVGLCERIAALPGLRELVMTTNGSQLAKMAAPLAEGACGEQSPLTLTGVMSRGRIVPLSSPVTTNCQMATALPDWVATVDGYAQSMLESPLAQLDTGTGYMCRKRNSGAAGFTSEHGFANALDIVGFTLEDGRSIAVAVDWARANAPEGRLLRLAHDAACASFMTVLGPEADAEHEDHLHLDLGCHGQSCRARICQ